jgi:hypothetical protein
MRSLPLSAALILLTLSACSDEKQATTKAAPEAGFRLLQANIGNIVGDCKAYAYNLCLVQVEQRVADGIAALKPDVLTLQEVTSDAQCEAIDESDPGKVCHPDHRSAEPSQVRRILGPDYSIACDARNGYECVAVATGFGAIAGCERGALCATQAQTPASPDGCDAGFTVSAVTVEPDEGPAFVVVNGHPPSGTEDECRDAHLKAIFESTAEEPALVGDGPALVSGDFNLDPYTDEPIFGPDISLETWDAWVGEGKPFRYHSGIAEKDPPYPTATFLNITMVLDHVASNFAQGVCKTLGEAPGTVRLDGGHDELDTDHRALDCRLRVE